MSRQRQRPELELLLEKVPLEYHPRPLLEQTRGVARIHIYLQTVATPSAARFMR